MINKTEDRLWQCHNLQQWSTGEGRRHRRPAYRRWTRQELIQTRAAKWAADAAPHRYNVPKQASPSHLHIYYPEKETPMHITENSLG